MSTMPKHVVAKEPAAPFRGPLARMDAIDHEVLDLLQHDAGRSDAYVARQVGLSPSGLRKRLDKLERGRVIKGRVALLDRDAIGLGLLCFIQVTLTHHRRGPTQEFTDRIQELPEVLECHFLTGENDYLLKVVATGNRHLERILAEDLAAIPGVDRLRTSIVLNEVKGTTTLPLRPPTEETVPNPPAR